MDKISLFLLRSFGASDSYAFKHGVLAMFLVIEFLFYMNLFVLNFCILAPGSLKLVSAFQ